MFVRLLSGLMISAVMVMAFSSVGCNEAAKTDDKKQAKGTGDKKGDGKKEITKGDTKHDGWWCQEHGVPEHICSLCSDEYATKAKKEGDWCKIHDRAQSQCFKCDPDKYKKFEDMHVAKYGKAPERPPESEFKK
jgi:hypothetical protein